MCVSNSITCFFIHRPSTMPQDLLDHFLHSTSLFQTPLLLHDCICCVQEFSARSPHHSQTNYHKLSQLLANPNLPWRGSFKSQSVPCHLHFVQYPFLFYPHTHNLLLDLWTQELHDLQSSTPRSCLSHLIVICSFLTKMLYLETKHHICSFMSHT